MSVNVGQRNVPDNPQNRQLEACEKAMELAMHTIKLCVNENVFVKEYQSALTDDIIRTAKDIYINAWSGNNVYVNSKERWTERERYQLTAITKCNELLALINIARSFLFLGFEYKVTETGKIVMTLNSANVKHERRKLRKMVNLAKQGKITKSKVDECYQSWKANASKGNSYKLIQRMDKYYHDLWRENYESKQTNNNG